MRIGYTLMTEQSGPKDLVRWAVGAEEAGFDFEVMSDHYSPWLSAQGHAPYAWSVLGAVAHAVADAGAFAVVMEMVPGDLAARVTSELDIPTGAPRRYTFSDELRVESAAYLGDAAAIAAAADAVKRQAG